MKAAKIVSVIGREIMDSRGNPTVPTLPRNQKTHIKKSKEFQRFSLLF
ncbi:MAG: hypothetical protein IJT01_10765 [Selenomonadaceae bacterium]|nr:hypothetical protein [Selenomonadaceae bacterium]